MSNCFQQEMRFGFGQGGFRQGDFLAHAIVGDNTAIALHGVIGEIADQRETDHRGHGLAHPAPHIVQANHPAKRIMRQT